MFADGQIARTCPFAVDVGEYGGMGRPLGEACGEDTPQDLHPERLVGGAE